MSSCPLQAIQRSNDRRERVGRKLAPGLGSRVEHEIRLLALLFAGRVGNDPVACLRDRVAIVERRRRQFLPAVVFRPVGEKGPLRFRLARRPGEPQVRSRADNDALGRIESDRRVRHPAPGPGLRVERGVFGQWRRVRPDNEARQAGRVKRSVAGRRVATADEQDLSPRPESECSLARTERPERN